MRGHTAALGGAFMTFGGIGAGILATVASTSDKAAGDWHKTWFLTLISLCGFVAVSGLYIVCAGAIAAVPPKSWSDHVAPVKDRKQGEVQSMPTRDVIERAEAAADAILREREEQSQKLIFDQSPPELADITPAFLLKLLTPLTDLRARELMAQHVGKQVRVSGEVESVEASRLRQIVIVTAQTFRLRLFFDDAAYDPDRILLMLNKGDNIGVSGQILEIGQRHVYVNKCKEIEVRGRAVPVPDSVPATAALPDPEERTFVDVTPAYLAGLYANQTSIQADKLAAGYLGKWLRVSGPLGDVLGRSEYHSQVTFQDETPSTTYMYFKKEWDDQLALIPHGTRIRVVGKIGRISRAFCDLEECELVNE